MESINQIDGHNLSTEGPINVNQWGSPNQDSMRAFNDQHKILPCDLKNLASIEKLEKANVFLPLKAVLLL